MAFTPVEINEGMTGRRVRDILNSLFDAISEDLTSLGDLAAYLEALQAAASVKVDGLVKQTPTIEQGYIVAGSDTSSPTRIRTNGYVNYATIRVELTAGKYYVVGYNESGYISTGSWKTASETITISGATKYRVVFAYSNDGNITPAKFADLGAAVYGFDDSLKKALLKTDVVNNLYNDATDKPVSAAVAKSAGADLYNGLARTARLESIVHGRRNDLTDILETGNISISNSGWSYSNSSVRCRTKRGMALKLKTGDKIGLSDYTYTRFYVGMLKSNGTYSSAGWLTSDYTIGAASGDVTVVVTISQINETSPTLTPAEMSALFFLESADSVPAIKTEIQGLQAVVSGSIDLDSLERRNGYLDSQNSYKWAGTTSTNRKHVVIPLNAGDKITIKANDSNAEYGAYLREYDYSEIQDGDASTYTQTITIAAGNTHTHVASSAEKFLYLQYNSGTSIYLAKSVTVNPLVDRIASLDSKIGKVDENIRTDILGGDISGEKLQFEIGHVAISNSGWSFSTNAKRVRIERGNPLVCSKGDILKLTNYSVYHFYVGWRVNNTYSYHNGWLTEDFTCPVDGEYEILIAKISSETTITVPSDISQYFVLKKKGVINGISSTVKPRTIRSVAHQGYTTTSSSYGNNFAEGYVKAAELGFDYGECDIVFSSDGVPFCCHPTKINDVWVNAFRDPVAEEYVYFAENTAEQILAHKYIDSDHRVSTFEEVVAACKSVGLGLYVDKLDNVTTSAKLATMLDIIKKYTMCDRMVYLCLDESKAAQILEAIPTAFVMLLRSLNSTTINMANRLKTNYNRVGLDVSYSDLTVADLESAYEALAFGISIDLYTVDNRTTYRNFMPYVAGITSNTISEVMLT